MEDVFGAAAGVTGSRVSGANFKEQVSGAFDVLILYGEDLLLERMLTLLLVFFGLRMGNVGSRVSGADFKEQASGAIDFGDFSAFGDFSDFGGFGVSCIATVTGRYTVTRR